MKTTISRTNKIREIVKSSNENILTLIIILEVIGLGVILKILYVWI